MSKSTSIIDTRPASGWNVRVFREGDLGLQFAPGPAGTTLDMRRRFSDAVPAFRYTWMSWALGVLGEPEWEYDREGDPKLVFVGDTSRSVILTQGPGPSQTHRVWWIRGKAHELCTDPVAVLVLAALESIRRRL